MGCLWWLGVRRRGIGFSPGVVYVVYPDPCSEVWLLSIKQAFRGIPDGRRHILELAVFEPVPCGIIASGKFLYAIFVDAIVELK
jgi:hypothetical protein